jgi:hypothetical protein
MPQSKHFPVARCERCNIAVSHPVWKRIDRDEYLLLCTPCKRVTEATFTPERAIVQAEGIIMLHQAWLYAGVQR